MANRDANIDCRMLKTHGLPTGVLDVPIVLFRSPTGGTYHTMKDCRAGKARSSARPVRETVTFAPVDVGPVRIGKCCIAVASANTSAAIGYTNRLSAANTWLTNAKRVLALPVSVVRKSKALAVAAIMPTQWSGSGVDELSQLLLDIQAELHDAVATTPDQFVPAAAWAIAGTSQVTNGRLVELAGGAAVNTLLFDAAIAVSNGTAPREAIASALVSFQNAQADIAVSLDRLPTLCQFDHSTFDHPRDWAQAEWASAFETEVATFPALWLQWLASLHTTLSGPCDLVVALVNPRSNPEELSDVTATCFTLQLTAMSHEVLVVIPEALADTWAAAGSLTYSSPPMPARDAMSVLPLAATLRKETHKVHPITYTLQTAVAVIAPAS